MELTWYYYLSYWSFIWFVLFKLGFINYSPYLMYLFTFIFIITKAIRDIIYFINDKEKIKNFDLILAWIFLILLLDIIPFFYLERRIDKESILFTVCLILTYLIFMNRSGINVIDHYRVVNYRELTQNNDLKTFFKKILIV
jgi:hypothetical protein